MGRIKTMMPVDNIIRDPRPGRTRTKVRKTTPTPRKTTTYDCRHCGGVGVVDRRTGVVECDGCGIALAYPGDPWCQVNPLPRITR